MIIEEFLKARLLEVKSSIQKDELPEDIKTYFEILVQSVEDVLEWHRSLPVLVEVGPPSIEENQRPQLNIYDVTYRMTQKLTWMTNQSYIQRFGAELPSLPLLRKLATNWRDHADFEERRRS